VQLRPASEPNLIGKIGEAMISDVLYQATKDIRQWLNDLPEVYTGEMRERVAALVTEMDTVRTILDSPIPPPSGDALQN
jgi:hypothetical protein